MGAFDGHWEGVMMGSSFARGLLIRFNMTAIMTMKALTTLAFFIGGRHECISP